MCELALTNPHFEQCVHCRKMRVWLGKFEMAEDAAHAYDEAAGLMCGVKARTNFPYDPHVPKRPNAQLLSATLTAKLHRWYLQSQQQEGQPAGKSKPAQLLTCLCLDNQQSNLGIYQKKRASRRSPTGCATSSSPPTPAPALLTCSLSQQIVHEGFSSLEFSL